MVDEGWQHEMERRVSKLEVGDALHGERHRMVINRLDKIDGHITRLVWLVISAIVVAFMTYVLRGGLTL